MGRKAFQRKDRFYTKAKDEGYVARSAYKAIELDRIYKIFEPGKKIIDLGCAPGGWIQVAQKKMKDKGLLLGVDRLPLKCTLSPHTQYYQGDFLKSETHEWIFSKAPEGLDWVISDLSPDLTGISFKDHTAATELCNTVFEVSKAVLKKGGSMLFKFFPCQEIDQLKNEIKPHFGRIEIQKLDSTRSSSKEHYMVALKKKI